MKSLFKTAVIIFLFTNSLKSQTKVAILDFENTSGISKYDGFGKALSNMLITDLKNSIHPRKITFLERSQLNKILSEQNLQKSKNFDKSTAVSFGKLAGVKYVLVGSVYVMDGTCNITSRLVDVQTSEIVHAKESNGKITNWLSLKSVLANELSTAMNNPVKIEAVYSKKETTEGVLTQYAKVIDKIDEGDIDGAQEMTEMLSSVQPDFKYFDELKLDLEELKKQVKENTENISVLKKSGGLVINASNLNELKNNLESKLLSYDNKLEIVKTIMINFGESIKNFVIFNDLKLNEYSVKMESNIKYYESLTNKVQKDLFFDFLKNESTNMFAYIRLFDNYQDNISDETVLNYLLAYIKILKIEYKRMPSPPILESEFIYVNLLYNSPFYPNEIGFKNKRRILSKEFINLRISVLNNLFSSQKKQIGVNLDVINYLQKYFAENYDKFTGTNENIDDGRLDDNYFFVNIILHIILDRHNQETRNKIKEDFFKYSSIEESFFYNALKILDLPLFIKNNKVLMSYNEKMTSNEAIEFYTSKTNVSSYDIKYLFNINSNKILFSNESESFKPLVENYIEIKKKIYFDYQLHNFNSTEETENQSYINKFKKFDNYNEFLKYFNSIEYPQIKYDYENYLMCDFIPEGTHVVFSTSDSYFKEFIVLNSGGRLRNNEIVLPNEILKDSKYNLLVVDKPKYDILNLNPSHFEFIGLRNDYESTENIYSEKNKMFSAIYNTNRNLMDKGHKDYRLDYDSELDFSNVSRIKVLLTYMEDKNEEKLIEIENIFPSKRREYIDEQVGLENLLQESMSYFNKIMAFAKKDTSSFIDLPKKELINIYSWRNGFTERQTENDLIKEYLGKTSIYPNRVPSNYELFDFFNTAFNELLDPKRKVSKERLSRAIIYNSIVFDFFKNINEYVDDVRNLENNKLKIKNYNGQIEINIDEFRNASRINTAHALLVYSFKYEKSLYSSALKLYRKELKYKFGESFMNLSSEDMIKQDLFDFQKSEMIDEKTKNKVLEDLKFK